MQSSNNTKEKQVYSVLDDFEEGDKVSFFRNSASSSVSGIVESLEEDYFWVSPFYNGPNPDLIRVGTVFQGEDDIHYVGQWRKIPDDTLIKVGDIMSTTQLPWVKTQGIRELFTVVDIIPGRKLALQSHENSDYVAKMDGSHSLDSFLMHWEMEG